MCWFRAARVKLSESEMNWIVTWLQRKTNLIALSFFFFYFFFSSPQPPAQLSSSSKREWRNKIWVLLTHSPSILLPCHSLSTPILIRIMWFYKVTVRRGDEATNWTGCLTSLWIVTTHTGAGSLIGGPAESWGNVSFPSSISGSDGDTHTHPHPNTRLHTHLHTHTHTHAESQKASRGHK